ncbi:Crp/Fnr family transcriptional regulator [Aurantiacibacter poecillastricola]|uniref:Crp/Fnr family transcriptional regulator n=1 Tax=Aurantiacibacter poecillastricola TaxID=3064385 RepID=UPI00273F4052|nr:Crp/Fnr family transcriptional regulator [Aurantiacibacter sp. 219JJ12-13]MDP5260560.1 Crp/Fnr family transcriptional regulator [Aurantiacibacter sp. 219JJ12-13]
MAKARLCEDFNEECRDIVEQLFVNFISYSKKQTFFHEGDDIGIMFLVCSGWAARAIHLADGRRQITEIFLPGDLFPVHASISQGVIEDEIVALGECRVTTCSPGALNEASRQTNALTRTLWWLSQRDAAILRMWIAMNGQYRVYERVAHLVCEVLERLKHVGLGEGNRFDFPLTQQEIGDIIGATPVHVSRSLKQIRDAGLLDIQGGVLQVHDLERLQKAAHFNPGYLNPR